MSFDSDGFIGSDRAMIRDTTRQAFPDVFSLAEDVNRMAHRIRNTIRISPTSTRHLVLVTLMQRIIDGLQADIVLSELGFGPDANGVLRTAFGAAVMLLKLHKDPEFLTTYVGADQVKRRLLIDLIREGKIELPEDEDLPCLIEIRNAAQADIDRLGLGKSDLNIEQLAADVDLDQWYQKIYRQLCEDTHVSVRSLEGYMVASDEAEFETFHFGAQGRRS